MKISILVEPRFLFKHEVINFSRELNILLQLKHPLFIELIGYALEEREIVNNIFEVYDDKNLRAVLLHDRHEREIEDYDDEESEEEENKKENNKKGNAKKNKKETKDDREEEEDNDAENEKDNTKSKKSINNKKENAKKNIKETKKDKEEIEEDVEEESDDKDNREEEEEEAEEDNEMEDDDDENEEDNTKSKKSINNKKGNAKKNIKETKKDDDEEEEAEEDNEMEDDDENEEDNTKSKKSINNKKGNVKKNKKDTKKDGEEEEEAEEDTSDESDEDIIINFEINDTFKLIVSYGIAEGMAYLHSHNILHRDLKPSNIIIDINDYPQITGLNIAKEINGDSTEPNETIKGTPIYIAPEVYLNQGYSKASDVYSYSLILYELITGEIPYKNLNSPKEIKQKVAIEQERPTFDKPISECYRKLIEKCWSADPKSRPTFEEIAHELRSNPEFITESVEKESFLVYIALLYGFDIDEEDIEEEDYESFFKSFDIDAYIKDKEYVKSISFNPSRRIDQLDLLIKNKLYKFKEMKQKLNFGSVFETETNNVNTDFDYADMNQYQKIKLIKDETFYQLYLIRKKETNTLYIAKRILMDDYREMPFRPLDISNELNNLLKINHPSFLKFIKYSPLYFKNKKDPVAIFENASNGTLDRMIEVERKNKGEPILNDTKKLIILYGIASGMSYLHSMNIIHCRLRPSNIFLDDFLFPKITGFDFSRSLSDNPVNPITSIESSIKDDIDYYNDEDIHNSPEFMENLRFSAACDVYSFAIIAFELITNEIPFRDGNCFTGYRPVIKDTVPNCYKKLIERCWAHDPMERPTFDEILNHLKTEPEFISEKVDKEEFLNYLRFNEEILKRNNSNDELFELDNFIQTQNQRFRKVKVDYKKYRDLSRLHLDVNLGSSDLNMYIKQKKIGNGSFGNVYKVMQKQSDIIYAAKVSIYEIDQCSDDTVLNLSREIDIISSLYHPSILRFIGYCPMNFKSKPKPVIITEFAPNGSLEDILKCERNNMGNLDWDDTKKLINIYGIAAGMAYLEKRHIVHRDLKPANILLDEFLYPKIADFGMSKKIQKDSDDEDDDDDEEEKENKKRGKSGFKGTLAYSSPEILKKNEYSQKGDVYSFAMIMYEIMTGEVPFSGGNQYDLFCSISEGYRPEFKIPIPYCYKNLIQKCWSENMDQRPSFAKIRNILESDPNFITPNINEEEYLNYVEYMNEFQQSDVKYATQQQEIQKIDSAKTKFNKVSTNLQKIDEVEDDKYDFFLDLNKYQRQQIINKKDKIKICQICEIETQNIFAAHISMMQIKHISKEEIDKLSCELDIISHLNHPSLLKFIGFSLYDFKNERRPVIVTEFVSNGTLEQILELEKDNKKIYGWDDTKKLIVIFGIASAMSYMHSHGIIHRSLDPSNIYLDNILFPKIGDFGLLTRFSNTINITHQSITAEKGLSVYSAPEVLESNLFSKASDVYSFALILYEILTNEKPFGEIDKKNQIYNKVVINCERPILNDKIPSRFKKLIEQCWSQNPDERPEFNDIVHYLEFDHEFITGDINKEDYLKYIKFVNSHTTYNESNNKINENDVSKNDYDNMPMKISEENIDSENLNDSNQQKIIEEFNSDEDNQDETDILHEKIQEEETNLDEENVQERSLNLENADNINQQSTEEPNIDEENHNEDDISTENPINTEIIDDLDQSKSTEEPNIDEENEISDLPENVQEKSLNIENADNINQQQSTEEPNIDEENHNEDDLQENPINTEIIDDLDQSKSTEEPNLDEENEISNLPENVQEKSLNIENADNINQQQSTEEPNIDEENHNEDDLSTENPINTKNSDVLDQREANKEPVHYANSNFIEENEITNSISIFPEKTSNSISTEQMSLINDFISSRNVQGLMEYLNMNCDNETTSFIFNKFHQESPDLYLNLCEEGISLHNAVAHHKYAISLIFDSNPPNYEEAVSHLKESIELGFNFSYFSLSRLYYEVYNDKTLAYQTANEGEKQGEKYSKCLLGFYVAHGIGTTKNLVKGASMILKSEVDDFYENFATEIGLYYSMKNEDDSEIFKWFEKAFNLRKTKATINNYGICFMRGIGVDKNDDKAREIFQFGADKKDTNSMYHLAFLLEKINPEESFKYYKLAAEEGDPRSQYIYAKLLERKDESLSLKFYKKAAEAKIIEAQEFLALNYVKENDTENILNYICSLISEGSFDVPLKYATFLYKSKYFKQAFFIYSILSKNNHPIASYFIGVMKYKGEGCIEDKDEAYKIMKNLSNQGIERASEFLEDFDF